MLKVYNTLTREKESFTPIKDNTVTMYSCGPTVYNYAHIGNLRTYIFMDIVRRSLAFAGYKVKGVLNITDVGHLLSDADDGDDKMAMAAREQKKSPYEIADFYTSAFFKDLGLLNIGKPEIIAKATEHIPEMISYVVTLCDKGYAYETSDGIYFDIAKFEGYGKLSGINLEEQQSGARVEVNSEKRHPADFALWKKADKNHIMQWESPWGMGYPGWHIECSAMSKKYLGRVFDIHSGGVDHIPIHHENEIAQSEALEGVKTVNYWLHGEFMLVDNGKMSKSLGNTYTVEQLAGKGYAPMHFRYFCLNAHYRKKLNFTFEGMNAAKTAYERLCNLLLLHKAAPAGQVSAEKIAEYMRGFSDAVLDDFNLPLALGVLWTMLKENKSKEIYDTALKMDKVFGLGLSAAQPSGLDENALPQEVRALLAERAAAREEKDFAKSDELRGKINAAGYAVMDTREGQRLIKVNEE